MRHVSANECPPALALERYAFESEETLDEATVSHIRTCSECLDHVRAMRTSRARFQQRNPSRAFIDKLDTSKPTRRFGGWLSLATATALAASAVLVLGSLVQDVGEPKSVAVTMKGSTSPTLHIYVSREGKPAVRADLRDPLLPGDRIRFVADLPSNGYPVVLSVDRERIISVYTQTSELIPAGNARILPGTIELDDYVGEELLVLLVGEQPMARESAKGLVRRRLDSVDGELQQLLQRGLGNHSAAVMIKKAPR